MQPTDADAYFGKVLRDARPSTRTGRAVALTVYFRFLELPWWWPKWLARWISIPEPGCKAISMTPGHPTPTADHRFEPSVFLGSTGLAVLINTHTAAIQQGTTLQLRGVSKAAAVPLKLTELINPVDISSP
jgi:hypothetical protein